MVLMGMLAAAPTLAQQSGSKPTGTPPQKMPHSATGSVSGRIFLITKAGDLKPARMARLYLFWENGSAVAAVEAAAGAETSPGLFYLKKNLEATEDANKTGASQLCRTDLLNADKAVLATLDWAQEHKLMAYVATLDADEEGQFSVGKIRPGLYELIARGQAGINDAYWLQQITVKSGQKTEVKVSSVEASCANDDQ